MDEDITPPPSVYAEVLTELSKHIKNDFLHSSKSMGKITQAFRLTYYQIAAKTLKENRQVIPCYAGYASCQITPSGEVWPCCILGYDKPMGNLRDVEYNFKKVWFSREADEIRKYIKHKNCACPLANASYTNMLHDPKTLVKVARMWLS
jgi:radical SAM protein with 4Fe4S-binding SPASM domain